MEAKHPDILDQRIFSPGQHVHTITSKRFLDNFFLRAPLCKPSCSRIAGAIRFGGLEKE